jgi:hypothetical protein
MTSVPKSTPRDGKMNPKASLCVIVRRIVARRMREGAAVVTADAITDDILCTPGFPKGAAPLVWAQLRRDVLRCLKHWSVSPHLP